jgi:hypothetical protein
MTIIEAVQDVLENDAALTAVIPDIQIRAPGPWQAIPRPYIIHFPTAITPASRHGKHPPDALWDYEVSIFSATLAQGEAAALLVIAALDGRHSLGSPVSDEIHAQFQSGSFYQGRDDEEDVEHFALSFRISKAL